MNDLKITDVRAVMGDSAFLIDNGETAIMYDSGFGFTAEAVCSKIASELGDRELNYIFLIMTTPLALCWQRENGPMQRSWQGSMLPKYFLNRRQRMLCVRWKPRQEKTTELPVLKI